MTTRSTDRIAKLPPDPDEIVRTKEFRALIKKLVFAAGELALAVAAQGIAEAKAAPAPEPQPQDEPPQTQHQPNPAQAGAPQPPTPTNPAAAPSRSPRLLRGSTKPAIIVAHLLRGIESLIKLDAHLGAQIAKAYTTAEMAGLHHPNRQPILDYLHEAVRNEDPWQFQRTSHHEMEIRVCEDLGFAPDRNPGDIIAQLCQHFHLPNNPEDYPNGWRPTRDWPDD